MRRRYLHARSMAAAQAIAFDDLTTSLLKENTDKWERQVTAWEADMTLADPYISVKTGKCSY